MLKTFDEVRSLAQMMEDDDSDRDAAYQDYKDYYHLEYQLPDEIRQLKWVRKVVSHDPHDAIGAGKRVLSSVKPNITFQPLLDNEDNKDRANEIEKLLEWQLMSADKRRKARVVEDLTESSLLYAAVAVLVIDLDWHIKQLQAQGRDTKAAKRARKKGRFLVNVYDPMAVHVREGNLGTHTVLLKELRSATDVLAEWGDDENQQISSWASENEDVYYFDFMDDDIRCVWVSPVGRAFKSGDRPEYRRAIKQGGEVVIMEPTEHKLEFSPWVALMGGSSLETEGEHMHQPMLYPLRRSKAWETLNIAESLAFSDAIAKAARPEVIEEGPNPQTAEVDYTDASKHMKMPAGNQAKAFPASPLDPGKSEFIDRTRQSIEKSTVSSVLQGAGLPSNVAFASLNLATQTAVGSLKPAKFLAEKALAEIFEKMLLWTKQTGNELEGYIFDKDDEFYGKRLKIEGDEIDEEFLYITVELTPDVPTDRQQRANTASLLVQALGYPKEMALEDVGVSDPARAMKQNRFEQMVEQRFSLLLQKQQAELDLAIEQQRLQLQGMFQMQMQEMQMAMAQEQQPQGPPGGAITAGAVMPDTGPGGGAQSQGGFANSPNQGGLPPAMANPEGLQSGVDAGGQPVQGIEQMITGQGEGLAG